MRNDMKLDILAFAAHPDDTELSCGGTILKHVAQGKKVGVVDLTRGELGTRGTPEIRAQEAAKSAQILGLTIRENLGFADGFFTNDKKHQLTVIQKIRAYQPTIVLANAIDDRHPDHGKGASLLRDACFLAGLKMIETYDADGKKQAPWRPNALYHYIQDTYIKPDFVVDISGFIEQKMAAIQAFSSQFYNPTYQTNEPQTYISDKSFINRVKNRAADLGKPIGVDFAEGFTANRSIGVGNLFDLL